MRRVVVTGIGINSSLGLNSAEVLDSLQNEKSGIRFKPDYQSAGLRCHVAGSVDINFKDKIDRKHLRFMGDSAAYAYLAMQDAIDDAGLDLESISHPRIGAIIGAGGACTEPVVQANDLLRTQGVRKIGPYRVTSTMGNTTSAAVCTFFKIQGINYSITSACATSAHCIGAAMEQIQWGKQDMVFAGGGEAEHVSMSCLFDAMGAFSTNYNDCPENASRPYDKHRDGFVIAGGGGVVVLEELEHAKRRGANIYAEVVGYGASSDGYSMTNPSGDGAERAMRLAIETVSSPIDYVNTHGTSTKAGDIVEVKAMESVFGDEMPYFSSTKSLSGHSLGAAGVHESIYCLLMLKHNFMAASANIEELDPELAGKPVVRQTKAAPLHTVMSNSFGFGGTNATLVFTKVK
jgi:3-oxoacyl-[acyl-carrier-protein] synthase-1